MNSKSVESWLNNANAVIYKHRHYIIASYLILSVIFFSIQFDLLRNWDMLVRILNSNYLFHNGNYFENQRALLESFIIGILSFVFGSYAVFAFIALFTVIFFISIYVFSKAFNVEYIILLGILLNPFFLFYAVKNGSELPMYSFLILFISFVKIKNPLAGLFIAFAFVSKYDSVFFLPLALFLIDKKLIVSLKRILVFMGIMLLSLAPFFLYNILLYHDLLFTFFTSISKNSPVLSSAGISNVNSVYLGFYELLCLVPITVMVYLFRGRKSVRLIREKRKEIAILSISSAIALFLYFFASGLYVNGLGYYRFFLVVTVSLTLLLSIFTNRKMLLFTVIFFIISMVVAYHLIFSQNFSLTQLNNEITATKQLLIQKYGTANCTVQSNNWVYLDYYGISATYIRGENYSQYPILSAGKTTGNYTLQNEMNGIYMYTYGISSSKCTFTPVIDLKYGIKYDINASRSNSSIGCYYVYGKVHSKFILSSCIFLVNTFR